MPDRLSRRMVLLAAYEDFTRRETVSLREENFELMLKVQDKKAKVIAELETITDAPAEEERSEFKSRIEALLLQEAKNTEMLSDKMASNRQEHRRLSRNTVSANKFRSVYAAPIDRSGVSGTLKGKA
ncbi:hypothetical protein [Pelagicoccus mobilis]|uniref:Uncharacterized protein n=1 Tax=Pelagicoccus mobilis TaxID=415221 RepID=A0A934S6V8_9BACT|nr:hypothetical protein [Pelagicoccus mobilis]MBK1880464.1 hypothetical protein [Pelagicoccus mobilis]